MFALAGSKDIERCLLRLLSAVATIAVLFTTCQDGRMAFGLKKPLRSWAGLAKT